VHIIAFGCTGGDAKKEPDGILQVCVHARLNSLSLTVAVATADTLYKLLGVTAHAASRCSNFSNTMGCTVAGTRPSTGTTIGRLALNWDDPWASSRCTSSAVFHVNGTSYGSC
jgi:hypothetical protein